MTTNPVRPALATLALALLVAGCGTAARLDEGEEECGDRHGRQSEEPANASTWGTSPCCLRGRLPPSLRSTT